ncbi:hypothetical protein KUCAC02_030299 [Chaenocephalus aceratus]|uniref:Uncharacterized protein n=1 Tax=Chaenocephalus aceratus TaxID=36190 RepID=A0ACB9XIB0_CHAAC|nr:hypothetical protein KUCAC02_030299 [Chaenocephalus aceratus]
MQIKLCITTREIRQISTDGGCLFMTAPQTEDMSVGEHERLQVLAAQMKDSLEDKRDVPESEGKWHPAYQMPGNVIPAPPASTQLLGWTYL